MSEPWVPIPYDPTEYSNDPAASGDPSSDPGGSPGASGFLPSPAGAPAPPNIDRRPEPLHPESDSERQTGEL